MLVSNSISYYTARGSKLRFLLAAECPKILQRNRCSIWTGTYPFDTLNGVALDTLYCPRIKLYVF